MNIRLLPEGKLIPYKAAEELPPSPWLILSPHPDDETIGMGGTIAKAIRDKIDIYILEVTCSSEVRKQEAMEAASILGLSEDSFIFLDIEEGKILENKKKIMNKLDEFVLRRQVQTIFIPSPAEFHDDHRSLTIAVLEWVSSNKSSLPFDLLLCTYEITRQWECNFLVCIDETHEIKLKAISAFKSQNPEKYIKISNAINTTRCYTLNDCNFAEGFFLIPAKEAFRLFVPHTALYSTATQEYEAYIEDLKKEIWKYKQELRKAGRCIENLNKKLAEVIEDRDRLRDKLTEEIKKLQYDLKFLREENENFKSSLWWKLSRKFYVIRDLLLPENTYRRNVYNKIKKGLIILTDHGPKGIIDAAISKLQEKKMESFSPQLNISIPTEQIIEINKRTYQLPSISVISVLYNNSSEEVEKFIRCIVKNTNLVQEIILVDNSDTEYLQKHIQNISKGFCIDINYIKTKNNLGFGRAANIGIKKAQSDFILIINPDAYVIDECINTLLRTILSDKNIAIVEAAHIPHEHPKFYNPITLEPPWASACCFMARKQYLEEVNGFDENIFLYGEDVDLSWRLKAKGYKIVYQPKARVEHHSLEERKHLHSNNCVSNLYLRVKYKRHSIKVAFLCLHRGAGIKKIISTYVKGLKARSSIESNADRFAFFCPYSLGYEPFLRRGKDVPILELHRHPLVSIIIRTHNRPKLLKRALISVEHQTYPNIEVLIIEDKTNFAEEVAKNFPSLKIKIFKTDKGRTHALNIGLSEASGEYLLFLDDDDVLFADCIETLLSHALHENSPFAYGGTIKFESDDKINGTIKYGYFEPFDRNRIMVENFIPMGSFIISKELAHKVGRFDESLEYLEDWDFIRRAARISDFLFVPKDIMIYCVPKSKELFLKRQHKLDEAYSKVTSKDSTYDR